MNTLEFCNDGDTTQCSTATKCLVDILQQAFTLANFERLFKLVARLKEIIFYDNTTIPAERKFIQAIKNALRDAAFHDEDMTIEQRKAWIKQPKIKKIIGVLSLSINRKKHEGWRRNGAWRRVTRIQHTLRRSQS